MKPKLFILLSVLFALCFSTSYAETVKNSTRYHFKVSKKEYRFSTFFEIDSEDAPRGNVKKSFFRMRTNYDLSDINGWQATGIVRVMSLGLLFTWAKEIDMYDTTGQYIGMIDGQAMTTAAARYSIYDGSNNLVGIAFLDQNCSGFTITHPKSEAYTIARLKRNFVQDTVDGWDIIVYEKDLIDARIIRIFAAFVCDYQNTFKTDT
ncbi:hypothetical protein COB11_04685 [Candidatus Aerophobetes bacterium]|uniref:Uncharacterized protein n=1 Tax=Aerophobetes bacterium TaxID=2030807 RepID=A0A2A4YGL3_UNCAE|nr:MAG: hypothetical protein COB11_04685 [Candidatus Aerophobetes bacterium]